VNAQIGAARTAAGTPLTGSRLGALLSGVHSRLGAGAVTPIEGFIEALPSTKRTTVGTSLAGTKYAGVEAVNRFYLLQTTGLAHVVGVAAKIHGLCVGADKLGHFFGEGFEYARVLVGGGTVADTESAGNALEIGLEGLGATGVFSNADRAANRAGLQFYADLVTTPGMTFHIASYIAADWNEANNPSFYASAEGSVVWANLLTGSWSGTLTLSSTGPAIPVTVTLSATAAGTVTGSYSYTPPGRTTARTGRITAGTITQQTTSVTGNLPGSAAVSATPVSGVRIEFDWSERGSRGKGRWDSVNEQTLNGTWGTSRFRSGHGAWSLTKV